MSLSLLCGSTMASATSSTADESTIQQVIEALGIINGDTSGNLNLSANVTRAEFVKMLVCASTSKDQLSAVSNVSPFKDVPYSYWAAGYIKTAVDLGLVSGYVDGTFRPSQKVTLEEAVTMVERLLGYEDSDFTGSFPYGQLSLYESQEMNKNITATKGSYMTRKDCMHLFYNLLSTEIKDGDGKLYLEELGYTADSDGNVDYINIISENMEGPYVITSSFNELGISTSGYTIYRNGDASSLTSLQKYDVIYYSDALKTLWAYANSVTGTCTVIGTDTTSPTTVTVAGTSYTLDSAQSKLAFSTMGTLKKGDIVTLLLGKDDTVVYALEASDYATDVYGVVTSVASKSYENTSGGSYTARTLTVMTTDGQTYQVKNSNTDIKEGYVVDISFNGSDFNVKIVSGKNITGAVSSLSFADNVKILDVDDDGNAIRVYLSRLRDATLTSSDVKYYVKNSSGQITDLILDDFTGDIATYGIVTKAVSDTTSSSPSGSYTYLVGDDKTSVSTSGSTLGSDTGPAKLNMEDDSLSSYKLLDKLKKISALSTLYLKDSSGNTWFYADDMVIYHNDGTGYYTMNLNELLKNYSTSKIKAYYDDTTEEGGRIRIIIVDD